MKRKVMTPEQKADHIRELNRLRQERYREKNRAEYNKKMREYYAAHREAYKRYRANTVKNAQAQEGK